MIRFRYCSQERASTSKVSPNAWNRVTAELSKRVPSAKWVVIEVDPIF